MEKKLTEESPDTTVLCDVELVQSAALVPQDTRRTEAATSRMNSQPGILMLPSVPLCVCAVSPGFGGSFGEETARE